MYVGWAKNEWEVQMISGRLKIVIFEATILGLMRGPSENSSDMVIDCIDSEEIDLSSIRMRPVDDFGNPRIRQDPRPNPWGEGSRTSALRASNKRIPQHGGSNKPRRW